MSTKIEGNPNAPITQLERSVLVRYARGMSIKDIMEEDEVSRSEINRRIRSVREKFEIPGSNWAFLISFCYYYGIITLGDVFDSPTQGRAAGFDLRKHNTIGQ